MSGLVESGFNRNGSQAWQAKGRVLIRGKQIDKRNKKWGGKGREGEGESQLQKKRRAEHTARHFKDQLSFYSMCTSDFVNNF